MTANLAFLQHTKVQLSLSYRIHTISTRYQNLIIKVVERGSIAAISCLNIGDGQSVSSFYNNSWA